MSIESIDSDKTFLNTFLVHSIENLFCIHDRIFNVLSLFSNNLKLNQEKIWKTYSDEWTSESAMHLLLPMLGVNILNYKLFTLTPAYIIESVPSVHACVVN